MGRIAVSAGGSPGGGSWGDGSQPLAMGCVVTRKRPATDPARVFPAPRRPGPRRRGGAGPVAADLMAFVRQRHRQLRGLDPRRGAVFAALIIGTAVWRQEVGTTAAPRPEPAPRSPVMTASRAADVLGISDRAVREACTTDRLDAALVDGQWRIRRASVEAYEP
jgi:hypothetical protein